MRYEREAEELARLMWERDITLAEYKKIIELPNQSAYLDTYNLAKEKHQANLMKKISWGWSCFSQ